MSVKIAMIGAGYVGLVSGACFAEFGHDVVCIDKDPAKIDLLKAGKLPIYEPGLDQLVARNAEQGRLRFDTQLEGNIADRDAIFIAVGTPSEPGTDRADMKYVHAAAKELAEAAEGFTVVVTKSTVPVGTNRQVAKIVGESIRDKAEFAVASNPEFLREGAAISDFMEPDRVVVGCEDERAEAVMQDIYKPLAARGTPIMITDIETAEVIKYAANSFLAVKISFINEISNLCEVVGADVKDVAQGIGMDKRIGSAFLRVGPGWGGSCFPKDTRALQTTAKDVGVDISIVEAAMQANSIRKRQMGERIIAAAGGNVKGKKIGVLGLTFKGQTDDMRESPSLDIVPVLLEAGATVVAFDPSEPPEADRLLPDVALVDTPQEAAKDADVLAVMADWNVFASYDLQPFAQAMKSPVMVDLRNMYDREAALEAGFKEYFALGEKSDLPG